MKKILLIVSIGLVAAACLPQAQNSQPPTAPFAGVQGAYNTSLKVGNKIIKTEVVKSQAAMAQGLSGRQSMTDQQGMLFDFSGSGKTRPGFWMKDMKFNLDFIWIKNKKIIGITDDVPVSCQLSAANCQLPVYYPPSTVDMVLEVNAGWSEKYGIKVNDEINFY